MTKDSRLFIIQWFDQYVNRYRNTDGVLPAALELKYLHSRRVAKNARIIAEDLDLSQAEIILAEGCGLVHDIGRFPQYARYGSFHDANTVDHGMEGRKTLEGEKMPSLIAQEDWKQMACAVEYHNRKASDIPANLSGAAGLTLRLVRDADKLDIMDLVLQSINRDGFTALPDMLPHIRLEQELTPGVIETVIKTKTISISNLSTVADFMVMLASWFYDLNHAPTRKLATQRKIIQRIEQELPDTKAVRELLDDIKKQSYSVSIGNRKSLGAG